MRSIEFQARAWQRKLIECWASEACPRLHPHRETLTAALFLHAGMPHGPLPDDRLALIQATTRREEPSREAFVTLALLDYVEDLEGGVGSALLPFQLAFARSGRMLNPLTGVPWGMGPGIAAWSDEEDADAARIEPRFA